MLPLFLINRGAAQYVGKSTQLCSRCMVPGSTQNCQKEAILELLWWSMGTQAVLSRDNGRRFEDSSHQGQLCVCTGRGVLSEWRIWEELPADVCVLTLSLEEGLVAAGLHGVPWAGRLV